MRDVYDERQVPHKLGAYYSNYLAPTCFCVLLKLWISHLPQAFLAPDRDSAREHASFHSQWNPSAVCSSPCYVFDNVRAHMKLYTSQVVSASSLHWIQGRGGVWRCALRVLRRTKYRFQRSQAEGWAKVSNDIVHRWSDFTFWLLEWRPQPWLAVVRAQNYRAAACFGVLMDGTQYHCMVVVERSAHAPFPLHFKKSTFVSRNLQLVTALRRSWRHSHRPTKKLSCIEVRRTLSRAIESAMGSWDWFTSE